MSISPAAPVRLSPFDSIPELLLEEAHHKVNQRAYEFFLNRGGIDGYAMDDWLAAEQELISKLPAEVNVSERDIAIEVVLPDENLSGLTVYFDETRLVVAAAPDPAGKQVLQRFDLPERISMDGVDTDQLGRTLRIKAALASV